jgi:maltose O-acetyltransferase
VHPGGEEGEPEGGAPSMRARMLSGEPYLASDPEIAADSLRARALQDAFNRTPATAGRERRRILEELLGSFGDDSEVRPPFYCDYGYQIRIGARTFVNYGLVVLDVAPVVIGDDVQIGPYTQLLTATHPIDAERRRAKWEAAEPVTVGDNVWLGGGVVVLPGVTIGPDTVVGAGAVVTADLPGGVVAVGNPARVLRRR